LDLEDRTGNLDVGKEADFVVMDPTEWDMFNQSLLNRTIADDPVKDRDALLFQVLMQSREKTLRGTYVRGRKLEVGAE
jgi:guanine deaminase